MSELGDWRAWLERSECGESMTSSEHPAPCLHALLRSARGACRTQRDMSTDKRTAKSMGRIQKRSKSFSPTC